jgi:hypothetical protein
VVPALVLALSGQGWEGEQGGSGALVEGRGQDGSVACVSDRRHLVVVPFHRVQGRCGLRVPRDDRCVAGSCMEAAG